jgi:glyoxylase-like metal-dependent hydrolase (beta-lactamase superfamily II)
MLFMAIAFTICNPFAKAQNTPNSLNQPGYYSMALGDFEVIALSDGTIPLKLNELLTDAKSGEVERLLKQHCQASTIECSVNAYLIKANGKLILIDVGTSDVYGPALGHITESLNKIGYKPEQIDAILLTHIHMDHIGGLMNGDKIAFPNATVYISKIEADYYLNPTNKTKAAENAKRFFDGAELKLRPILIAGKLRTFDFGAELFPGITPVAGFGHTPGHSFYAIESKGEKMLFLGDILVSDAVQLSEPSITSVYDYDPKQASATRKKALAEAGTAGYWVGVSHISFPGIGHIRPGDKGYIWVPINYSASGRGQ